MIKVCEVISDTNIGGAGRLLVTRLSVSDRGKFDSSVLLPKNSELKNELDKIGIKVYEMDGCADRSFDACMIPRLVTFFKSHSFDIVNCHGCLSARIAAYIAGIPIRIYTRHCAYEPKRFMTSYAARKVNMIVNKYLNSKIIAVADAAAKNLTDVGVLNEQIEVIINGVEGLERYDDIHRFEARKRLGVPRDSFVLGICARLEDCKGIDTLIRAAEVLLRGGEEVFVMIVGKGSAERDLRELAGALGIESRVSFYGFASDVTPYVNCFDVNINCSRGTETSSLSLSEGMSIGLPCIASDYGGNTYMVRHGVNGLIFKTDDFVALAENVRILIKDKLLYSRLSHGARERFEGELNAKNMARKTEELYTSLFLAKRSNNEC